VNVVTERVIRAWQAKRFPSSFNGCFERAQRNIVDAAEVPATGDLDNRVKEQATHIAARLGIPVPEDNRRSRRGDPFVERAAVVGPFFSGQPFDPEPAIAAVLRGTPVGKAIVAFERFHIGEGELTRKGIYSLPEKPTDISVRFL